MKPWGSIHLNCSRLSPVVENSCSCQWKLNKRVPTISSEQGITFAFRNFMFFCEYEEMYTDHYQGVLNFAYCRQNTLELSHISGVHPIHTFSVWNIQKRNVENTRCEVKIGLTLENGQLQSWTTIYEMQYGTNIPAGLRTCAFPFFMHN